MRAATLLLILIAIAAAQNATGTLQTTGLAVHSADQLRLQIRQQEAHWDSTPWNVQSIRAMHISPMLFGTSLSRTQQV
jgi:hypothetical protein